MVTAQVIFPSETVTPQIVLPQVRWQTFHALMQDLSADSGYQIAYSQETQDLVLSKQCADEMPNKLALDPVGWTTYRALMQDVGDARSWRAAYAESYCQMWCMAENQAASLLTEESRSGTTRIPSLNGTPSITSPRRLNPRIFNHRF
jgi:hypothetical protein